MGNSCMPHIALGEAETDLLEQAAQAHPRLFSVDCRPDPGNVAAQSY